MLVRAHIEPLRPHFISRKEKFEIKIVISRRGKCREFIKSGPVKLGTEGPPSRQRKRVTEYRGLTKYGEGLTEYRGGLTEHEESYRHMRVRNEHLVSGERTLCRLKTVKTE